VRTEPAQIKNFINGEFVEPISGRYLDNVEPATGKPYSHVADSDAHDVDLAVAAAEKAFRDWSKKTAAERSNFLLRIAELIERDLEKFARAESVDTGKPISLARTLDIPRSIANFRFFATAILHTESEAHITDNVAFNYTLRQPRGIAGLISPWNLPLYLLSWKIAPAIAVGNTAIAKPSELTPMTAYMLCEIAREAGLPHGVLNVVHGRGPNVGAPITAHPKINTISFTGGTVTGRKVAEACAPLFKKVSLELGGKNPNIIFADADLDAAIAGSVRSSFANRPHTAPACTRAREGKGSASVSTGLQPAFAIRQSKTTARSCEALPQPTEWQHIGNQINAAFIFARADFKNVCVPAFALAHLITACHKPRCF
jgi:aminomuconate-semialdehyde/2-hydroxymuconate-6-semialdehyde dehydrogenase